MGKTILIVDDDSTTRKYLSFILRTEGYEIFAAQDGIEALEMLAGRKVDLVITDLNMPRMDGFELIRNIRKGAQDQVPPVILLTTEADEESRAQGVECGALEYMIKPVSKEVLAEKVREWIEAYSAVAPESGGNSNG